MTEKRTCKADFYLIEYRYTIRLTLYETLMRKLLKNEEPTNFEILAAINKFATYVEGQFQQIEQRFLQIDQRFEEINKRFERIEKDIDRVKSSMVTKSYLDDKLADVQADLGMRIHKVDAKLNKLVEIQVKRKNISSEDAKEVYSAKPFAKMLPSIR